MVSFTTQDNGRGAVLEVSSGWHLPETYTKGRNIRGDALDWNPVVHMRSTKIALHSPTPIFDNQAVTTDVCKITGGPCYSDVAFVAADAVFEVLVRVGEPAFWAELDGWIPEGPHKHRFNTQGGGRERGVYGCSCGLDVKSLEYYQIKGIDPPDKRDVEKL